jgi:hypothetical protein
MRIVMICTTVEQPFIAQMQLKMPKNFADRRLIENSVSVFQQKITLYQWIKRLKLLLTDFFFFFFNRHYNP